MTASAAAQDHRGSAAAGGALGLYAGAMVGNFGTILPCTQTALGARCVRGATVLGGAVGAVSGIVLGAADANRLGDLAVSGAIGLAAGSAVGFAARPYLQRFGLTDVLAVGLVGGAIGTQPRGALIGAAAGTAIGLVLWKAVPGLDMPDALGAALAGVMFGVLAGWVVDAVESRSQDNDGVPLFSLRLTL